MSRLIFAFVLLLGGTLSCFAQTGVLPSYRNASGGTTEVSAVNPFPVTGGGGGGGLSVTDQAAFTYGVSPFTPTGGFYNAAITALTSGQQGAVALTANRSMHVLDDNSAALLTAATSSIPAGANLIGVVGIDQTTPGTTNKVALSYGASALVDNPCETVAKTYTPISITTNTTTRIVAPTSAKKTYVCSIVLQTALANNVGVVEGTGGTCGTGTAGVLGGTTAASGLNLAANEGYSAGNGAAAVLATAGTNVDLCLITSVATNLAGHVSWVQK